MARVYQWRKNNPEKRTKQKRREKVRSKLRLRGFLPPVGVELNETQKIICEQITNDDFSFWDRVKLNGGVGRLHDGGKQIKVPNINKTHQRLIWERAKQSAQERKLDFNLDVDDIIIPEYCPLLSCKLTFTFTQETKNSYYSIDRIDSNLGYVKGNVQIMSLKANIMKNSATQDELLIFAKNIIEINSKNS
jgi:hypothetical protein